MEFLCWLDYANRLAKECHVPEIVQNLAENVRVDLFEMSIEPMISILDINIVGFMLVLMAKIIRQIDAPTFSDGERFSCTNSRADENESNNNGNFLIDRAGNMAGWFSDYGGWR